MHCRKCGKELTDATSRKRGYGPQCWKSIQVSDPNQTYFEFLPVEKDEEPEDPSDKD